MKFNAFTQKLFLLFKLCMLALLTGVLGGFVGAAFSLLLSFVTNLREAQPWLLLLLPLGGIATALVYRKLGMQDHRGTNEIIANLKNEEKIRSAAAPLIFVSTAVTHLLGGSAGREDAALQLGGAGASAVSDALRLKGEERTVFIMSGMSAVFASVFGTPLTAAFFVLEFKMNKLIQPLALLPCLISAVIAECCSSLAGVEEEVFSPDYTMPFSISAVGKILLLAVGLRLLSTVMCFAFEKPQHWAKKFIPNPIARALLFTVAVIAMTACVGDMSYNGSGMHMAMRAVNGEAEWFDFILKILFTSVSLAAGLKGGEIVPAFCIGATFGCVFGSALGIDAGLAAALGLIGIFCCATNSFTGAVFLSLELFGLPSLGYTIIICAVLWLLSDDNGIFENRIFVSPVFTKLRKRLKTAR